jgi:hypothetical protein
LAFPSITSLPASFKPASSGSGLEDDASADDRIDGGTIGAALNDDASGGIDDEAFGPRIDGGHFVGHSIISA